MIKIINLLRSDDGSASIETVIMLPFFLAVLGLMVDLSLIFNSRAEVLRVIQDANRNASVGRLADTASTETYVETMVSHLSPNADASAGIVAGVITTSVVYPTSDVMLTGMFGGIAGVHMTISAQHLIEDWEG